MFLHLGEDITVPISDIIAIIDISSKKTAITEEFLKTAKKEGIIEIISKDTLKTIIITKTNKKNKVYLSPVSSTTLFRRAEFIDKISKNCIL